MSIYVLLSIIIFINKKNNNMCIFFKFIKMLLIMGIYKYIKVFKKDIKVNKIIVN